jgi:hypothetical protein
MLKKLFGTRDQHRQDQDGNRADDKRADQGFVFLFRSLFLPSHAKN